MRKLNPEYVQAVRTNTNPCPYFDLLSMELTRLAWGEATVEIGVQRKHLQPYGIVHGGVFASLIDAATFWASYSRVPEDLGMTSVDLKLNYLAPVTTGRMTGVGRCLRAGNTLYLAEASVTSEAGQLVAHGTSTLMVLNNVRMEGSSGWPRKFLD